MFKVDDFVYYANISMDPQIEDSYGYGTILEIKDLPKSFKEGTEKFAIIKVQYFEDGTPCLYESKEVVKLDLLEDAQIAINRHKLELERQTNNLLELEKELLPEEDRINALIEKYRLTNGTIFTIDTEKYKQVRLQMLSGFLGYTDDTNRFVRLCEDGTINRNYDSRRLDLNLLKHEIKIIKEYRFIYKQQGKFVNAYAGNVGSYYGRVVDERPYKCGHKNSTEYKIQILYTEYGNPVNPINPQYFWSNDVEDGYKKANLEIKFWAPHADKEKLAKDSNKYFCNICSNLRKMNRLERSKDKQNDN